MFCRHINTPRGAQAKHMSNAPYLHTPQTAHGVCLSHRLHLYPSIQFVTETRPSQTIIRNQVATDCPENGTGNHKNILQWICIPRLVFCSRVVNWYYRLLMLEFAFICHCTWNVLFDISTNMHITWELQRWWPCDFCRRTWNSKDIWHICPTCIKEMYSLTNTHNYLRFYAASTKRRSHTHVCFPQALVEVVYSSFDLQSDTSP